MGIVGSYKEIIPQLSTPQNYKTDESIGGYNSLVFVRLKTD